jgi:hypothetical protein
VKYVVHRCEWQMQSIPRMTVTNQVTWEVRINSTYTELKLGVKRAVVNNDINGVTDPDSPGSSLYWSLNVARISISDPFGH